MYADELAQLAVAVLRHPNTILEDCDDDPSTQARLAKLAPRLLVLLVIGTAVLGAIVGSYRGGWQYLFAALKLPLLYLLPPLVIIPACYQLYRLHETDISYARLGLATLVGLCRTGLLASAVGPALWLYYSVHPDYHQGIIVFAATVSALGLAGLVTIHRLLGSSGPGRPIVGLTALCLCAAVFAQSGWLLRPFLVRPAQEDLVFLRSLEAEIFTGLAASYRSSQGHYDGWDAQPSGLSRTGEVRK